MFGWGNNEYNQLAVVERDKTQLNTPRHLPFTGVGKVVGAAAAGSMCALLNGKPLKKLSMWQVKSRMTSGYVISITPKVRSSSLAADTLYRRFTTALCSMLALCTIQHRLQSSEWGVLHTIQHISIPHHNV